MLAFAPASLPRRPPARFCSGGGRSIVTCCRVAAAPSAEAERARTAVLDAVNAVVDRGIFGCDESERERIDALLRELERVRPIAQPARHIKEVVEGRWRVLYTTLTILGSRRIQLAIGTSKKPGLVRLNEIFQDVQADEHVATNTVEFSIAGGLRGKFEITATYDVASGDRVDVTTASSSLQPDRLRNMLGDSINILYEIFNPEGYLDITYVDDKLRVGRDSKGHLYVLERVKSGA